MKDSGLLVLVRYRAPQDKLGTDGASQVEQDMVAHTRH